MQTGIDRFVAEQQEVATEQAITRWGMTSLKPEGDYTLVVAIARHVYREPARNVDERVFPGMQYWMETSRVERNMEAGLVHPAGAQEMDWWNGAKRILAVEDCNARPFATASSPGALKIIAGTGYDPGSAAFRLHTAINEHSKHTSAFVRWGDTNPHCSLRQLDALQDVYAVRDAVISADVLHNHIAYFLLNNTGIAPREGQLIVRHYHGSAQGDRTNLEPHFDRVKQALLLGARLQLCEEGKVKFGLEMDWSPIPMPINRYRRLRDATRAANNWLQLDGAATSKRPLRIAHTPTNMKIKGTDVLRGVIKRLQARHVPVELDLIHGVTLREALERQALCDVTFDSFWLGIQGSGLQAGAMEMPVIAGDEENRQIYLRRIGRVPYTFANDEDSLSETVERFAVDPAYREEEAAKVADYVLAYHDYPVVAAMYERTLARALNRPDVLTDPMRRIPLLHP